MLNSAPPSIAELNTFSVNVVQQRCCLDSTRCADPARPGHSRPVIKETALLGKWRRFPWQCSGVEQSFLGSAC